MNDTEARNLALKRFLREPHKVEVLKEHQLIEYTPGFWHLTDYGKSEAIRLGYVDSISTYETREAHETLGGIANALGRLTDRIVTVDLGTTETAYNVLVLADGQQVVQGEFSVVTKAIGGVIYMARRLVQS